MKKLKTLLPVILIIATTNAMAQNTQMSKWFIAPKVVDMPLTGVVSVNPIVPVYGSAPPATATQVANGMYDQSGNLLFYIADNGIYDYNNNLMGTLNPVNLGAEIAIVPFGNNDNSCQRKFNIFYLNGGVLTQTLVSLCKTVVDMNAFSVTNEGVIDNLGVPQEFGALAAGSRIINGNRFLYYLGGSGTVGANYDGKIRKVVIHSDGTVTMQPQTTWVYPPQYPWPNVGSDVFSTELELSPDGSYLAWASWSEVNPQGSPVQNRYHFIRLDPVTGDYIPNSYTEFNIPNISGNNISGFRGIEFFQDGTVTKLFMGAGADGIFYTDISTISNFIPVSSSASLGFSQIELSYNGYMYAASSSGAVGAFDPTITFPTILPNPNSFTLINPLPPSGTWGSGSFFTLPDQIDGQDYSAIAPAAVAPVITVSSYTFSGGNATWSYGNNPWNATATISIHIHKELIIEAGSNLTISGMTFKFGPEARVIIKQGAAGQTAGGILRLTNNTVFTSAYKAECPALYTWKGVEVLGVKTASQHVQNNPMIQGRLIIESNSRIEFAEYGARIGTNLQNAGGVVNANSGAVFYNCRTGVDFKPYQNFYISSGNTVNIGNRSSFYNTQFLSDEKFPFSPSAIRHVNIDNCSGIIFSTCTFHNNFSAQPQLYALNSFGIKSLNANFSVLNNSSFINLFRGIEARISSGNRNFIVTNSTFTDNQIGIFCDKVNNFGITGCTFFIGGNQKPGNNFHTGIRNQYGSGFTIEENTLLKSPNALANVSRWGILVLNTGDASNQIYKNTFSEMTIGNYASEQNRHPNNPFQGLQYLCNQNTGNINMIF